MWVLNFFMVINYNQLYDNGFCVTNYYTVLVYVYYLYCYRDHVKSEIKPTQILITSKVFSCAPAYIPISTFYFHFLTHQSSIAAHTPSPSVRINPYRISIIEWIKITQDYLWNKIRSELLYNYIIFFLWFCFKLLECTYIFICRL